MARRGRAVIAVVGWCAAARGTTIPGSCAPRFATGSSPVPSQLRRIPSCPDAHALNPYLLTGVQGACPLVDC